MKEFPLFPVSISESDFDNYNETSHGGGVIFEKGVIDTFSESYLFDIFGTQYKGIVAEDIQMSHISSRLEYPKVDMRQMKIYLYPKAPDNINRFITISYYLLANGKKECMFILCKKK